MIDSIIEVQKLLIQYLNSQPDILLSYHDYRAIDFDLQIPSGHPDEPYYLFRCLTNMKCRLTQHHTSTLMYMNPCFYNYKSTALSIGDFYYYYGAGVLQIREYKLDKNSEYKTLCANNKYINILTHDDLFAVSTMHSPEHLDKLYELHSKSECSTEVIYDYCTPKSIGVICEYLKKVLQGKV